MVIAKSRWSYAVLVGIAVGVSGCGASKSQPNELTATTSQALTSSNGIWTNGLTTNGIWTNGIWTNGIWTNGIWTNGIWTNGIWTNGVSSNGIWTNGIWTNGVSGNGIWTNGIWTNGIWTNGIWTNGVSGNGIWTNGIWTNGIWTNGIWTNGLAGDTLRSNRYTRQLLSYIYQCAMPPAVCPAGGAPTSYDTILDPNATPIQCTPSPTCDPLSCTTCASQGSCDPGYVCLPNATTNTNTCVIPLTGAIGLGINGDGSTWWGQQASDGGKGNAGNCDETCQRWVSACVLARTNAYGVHVKISMRAPADAPQAIKDALEVTDVERKGDDAGDAPYSLREGAYYGNIFATTPGALDSNGNFVPSTNGTPGTTAERHPGDAGASTRAPVRAATSREITKRFCSSQGDQVVINVPGVCLTTSTESGTCVKADGTPGEDTDPTSHDLRRHPGLLYGPARAGPRATDALQGGHHRLPAGARLRLRQRGVRASRGEPDELPERLPSGNVGEGLCAEPCIQSIFFLAPDSTIFFDYGPENEQIQRLGLPAGIAPDDSVVVASLTTSDINLGGGLLSATNGYGLLGKYNSDGTLASGMRFGNTIQTNSAGGLIDEVNGVAVAPSGTFKGTVAVVGKPQTPKRWSTKSMDRRFRRRWDSAGTWELPVGVDFNYGGLVYVLAPRRTLAVDSNGNIVVAGEYTGSLTLGSTTLTSNGYSTGNTNSDVFVAKLSPPWVSPPDGAVLVGAEPWRTGNRFSTVFGARRG